MKINKFESKEDWERGRFGKITGSKLDKIVTKKGTGKKIGYYELIAEKLGIPADDENPMNRGTRLESEAIERFEKESKKKVDSSLYILERDDNKEIAISPDGIIWKKDKVKEAVEVKCLSSARHIEAFLTNKLPSEYELQALQYFVVNDELETLYFCFYDPRLFAKPFFYLTIKRKDLEEDIKYYLDYQKNTLLEINEIVSRLSF
jgi:hypothetical protein